MSRRTRRMLVLLSAAIALGGGAPGWAAPFKEARIYIEFNHTANDLGYHVSLDAEDWKRLKIVNPNGVTIFEVEGKGPYRDLGMTELFFEGAEPSLDEFPLADLLALFPEGNYRFVGVRVDGSSLMSMAPLSHTIPTGPVVSAEVEDDSVVIEWEPVTAPPPGFPDRRIEIVGYQVIVDSFQVTLPSTSTEVTLPPELVESLGKGEHPFEVLAIDRSGNQSITEGSFDLD